MHRETAAKSTSKCVLHNSALILSGLQCMPGVINSCMHAYQKSSSDVTAWLLRLPWAQVQQLEAVGKHGIALASSMVTKMKVPDAAISVGGGVARHSFFCALLICVKCIRGYPMYTQSMCGAS